MTNQTSDLNYADIVHFNRVIPPLSPPPLNSFKGFLKRINSESLSHNQRQVLSLAAPQFFERLLFKSELDALRSCVYGGKARGSEKPIRLSEHSTRRYSGGDDLSRGRYYSLAKSASGDDGGTLRNELSAYNDVYWSGLTMIEDSDCLDEHLPDGHLKDGLRGFSKSILIVFHNTEEVPHRFCAQTGTRAFSVDRFQRDPSGEPRVLVFRLPYEVEEHSIPDVFDLREQAAQAWLVTLVKDGHLQLNYLQDGQEPPHGSFTFHHLLRHLVTTIPGGNMVTEVIGTYLRRLGVAGLVFPSARSDNFARYNEGRLIDDGGWNFLDLRGAGTTADSAEFFREVFDMSLTDFLFSTDFEEAGTARGSWSREAVARGHQLHNATAFGRILSETEEQRVARKEDYRLYWKTIDLLELPDLNGDLTEYMAKCGLDGSVDEIPVRMWQYVLHEALLHEPGVPRLEDAATSYCPLGLRLVGGPI